MGKSRARSASRPVASGVAVERRLSRRKNLALAGGSGCLSRGLVGVGVQRTCTPQPAMRLAVNQATDLVECRV